MEVCVGPLKLQSPMGVGTNCWGDFGAETVGVFRAAMDAGIDFIDTAEWYKGSEQAVGAAARADGRDAIIATKYVPMPWHCNFEENLLAHLDASLVKLRVPAVDLLYIHMPIAIRPLKAQAAALAKAVKLGKCRAVGVSNFNESEMRRIHAALAAHGVPLAANQIEFSLFRRAPETNGLLAACKELGVAVVAWSPIGDGRLCTPAEEKDSLPEDIRSCFNAVVAIAERRGKSTAQVALNWCICKGTIPLAGTSKQKNMEANAGALGWHLTKSEIAELDTVALEDKGTFPTKGLPGKLLKAVAQHS